MAKYWIDGLPWGGLDGDGSQRYWHDGLPQADLENVPPPDEWIPPGRDKPGPPKPPKPPRPPDRKDIREGWRMVRNDSKGRYIAESATFDVFAPPEVPSFTGEGGVIATSAISGTGVLEFIGAGSTIAEAALSGSGVLDFAGAGGVTAEATLSGSGTVTAPVAAEVGGSARRSKRQQSFKLPDFHFVSATREEPKQPIVVPEPEQPRPLPITGQGGVTASTLLAGTGALEFVGRGGTVSRNALAGAGTVEFIGGGGVSAASVLAGRGEVDNTIPEEDEELLILLAA